MSYAARLYNEAIDTQYDDLVTSIEKSEEFRQAASEMLAIIPETVTLKHVADPKGMKVSGGFLNLFKEDVPVNIQTWANAEARKIVADGLKSKADEFRANFLYMANCSLSEEPNSGVLVFDQFSTVTFYAAMDNSNGLADLGRNGAAIVLQEHVAGKGIEGGRVAEGDRISDYSRNVIDQGRTSMEKKALSVALNHFGDAAFEQIEKIRQPIIERVIKNSPAYAAPALEN